MNDVLGLSGEKALVVGGGYGIGRETALMLAKAGASVVVADLQADRAQAVASEIGGHAIAGDVTQPGAGEAIVNQAHETLGGLTKVANIVGLTRMGAFTDTPMDLWHAQFQLNLFQQMEVCRAAGQHMIAGGGGAIVMVASVAAYYGAPNQAAYGMTKAAILSLARTLAAEWGPHGIRVNCVAPDLIATSRLTDSIPGSTEQALHIVDSMGSKIGIPLGRVARMHEVAGPILFLLSDLAAFMTGQSLVVDGGTMVRFPHSTEGAKR